MSRARARWLGALVFSTLAGCGPSGGAGGAPPACKPGLPTTDACAMSAPSYATDIAPLVQTRCLSCHYAGNTNSTVVLETQAEMSREEQLVETQVYRCLMPPSDGTPLREDERNELLQWLVCGAPNN